MAIYDRAYFEKINREEKIQALVLAEVLANLFAPKSVMDAGCASGLYLKGFMDRGIDVAGIDIATIPEDIAWIPTTRIWQRDLRSPLPDGLAKRDLLLSLELLEHIEASYADVAVENLCKLSDTLIVSAGQPGQGGVGHVNCRPKPYWVEKFHNAGYELDDEAAERIVFWTSAKASTVMGWLIWNLMVFRRKDKPNLKVPNRRFVVNSQRESDITVTITSCGRFDLLKRTVDSLMATVGVPVRVLLLDDSEDTEQHEKIFAEYGNRFDVMVYGINHGQAWALDYLYRITRTPYIFHCEDDWEFLKGGYIEKSLDVLNERPDVAIVNLARNEEFEKLGAMGDRHTTKAGTVYDDNRTWRIDEKHEWWNGWCGSPNLKRKADWVELGPFQSVATEDQYDKLFAKSGMKATWLEDCYVKHIGYGRSMFKANQPHVWVHGYGPDWGAPLGESIGAIGPPGDGLLLTYGEDTKDGILLPRKYEWRYHPDGHRLFRFHLLGLAHVPSSRAVSPCAYTGKCVKLSKMLMDMGHEVYFYGGEGSDVECTEFIEVVSNDERVACYGDYDWTKEWFKHDGNDSAYLAFNEKAIPAINARKQERDFLLCSMGTYQKPIADAVQLPMTVESGIGYRGVFANFKIFESYAWMHYISGMMHGRGFKGYDDGSWYDAVIPNYFDPEDFPFQPEKDDYFLYIGRLIFRKGIHVAIQTTREIGAKLIIAGQGSLVNPIEKLNVTDTHVKHIGSVGPEERKELMGRAKGAFVATYYFEPFGGVAVELMLTGTPVLTTDWGVFSETVKDHVTGYRCRNLEEFVWGAKNIDKIDPQDCRDWAISNYSMDRVKWMYQAYFEQLADRWDKEGWEKLHNGRLDQYRRYQKFYPRACAIE